MNIKELPPLIPLGNELSQEGFHPWQKKKKQRLIELLGLKIFKKVPPRWTLIAERKRDNYREYNLEMETEAGIVMPFFLLVPHGEKLEDLKQSTLPVMILPHGHGSDGRYGVIGIDRHSAMAENRKQYNHDTGVAFANRGFLCFCPDSRGSGDRREPKDSGFSPEQLKKSSCNDLNNALASMGSCLAGAWVFDLMALLDLINQNQWGNSEKIGICGFSGGGLQALYTAALDERITAAAVSGYFHRWEDCFLKRNLCGCNYIPHFHQEFDLAQIASLIAPRPLIIEKGINDPLSGKTGIEGPRELAAITHQAYQLGIGKENFHYTEFEGGHHFDGTEVFPFMEEHLK